MKIRFLLPVFMLVFATAQHGLTQHELATHFTQGRRAAALPHLNGHRGALRGYAAGPSTPPEWTGTSPQAASVLDSARVAEVVERFRRALVAGDSAAVAEMLLPEALVLEGGGVETKREYLGHHFHADHAFLENMAVTTQKQRVHIESGAAWVSSARRMKGTYEERDLDLASAELMVLRRTPKGWKISAIHWSSRSRE